MLPYVSAQVVRPAPFEFLKVWQLAHKLAVRVYRVTAAFPARYRYGLALQLERSVSSIPANLAEGNGRSSRKEYRYFCRVAKGSVSEVRYFLRLAFDLGLVNKESFEELLDGYDLVGALLHRLIASLVS